MVEVIVGIVGRLTINGLAQTIARRVVRVTGLVDHCATIVAAHFVRQTIGVVVGPLDGAAIHLYHTQAVAHRVQHIVVGIEDVAVLVLRDAGQAVEIIIPIVHPHAVGQGLLHPQAHGIVGVGGHAAPRISDAGQAIGLVVGIIDRTRQRRHRRPVPSRVVAVGHLPTIRLDDPYEAILVVVRVLRSAMPVDDRLPQPRRRTRVLHRLSIKVIDAFQPVPRVVCKRVGVSVWQPVTDQISHLVVSKFLER